MASPMSGETDGAPGLTERETQVGELLAWGAAKKEVPALLKEMYGGREIRPRTVENITRDIYAKLHIGKASELSAWWFCHYYGVDKRLCPLKELRKRLYAAALLVIIIPGLSDIDNAVRPARCRTSVRIERTLRRKD